MARQSPKRRAFQKELKALTDTGVAAHEEGWVNRHEEKLEARGWVPT